MGILRVGAEGIDQSGAATNEIAARIDATSPQTWSISAGTLRLSYTSPPASVLSGVTMDLTGTARVEGVANSAAAISALNGATINLTGTAAAAPTLALQRVGTTGGGTFNNTININGAGNLAPQFFSVLDAGQRIRTTGPVNVNAGTQTSATLRLGDARFFTMLGKTTLASDTEINVAGGFTFIMG
jgi:hypothetical protein